MSNCHRTSVVRKSRENRKWSHFINLQRCSRQPPSSRKVLPLKGSTTSSNSSTAGVLSNRHMNLWETVLIQASVTGIEIKP